MLFIHTAAPVALVGGNGRRHIVSVTVAQNIGVRIVEQRVRQVRPPIVSDGRGGLRDLRMRPI